MAYKTCPHCYQTSYSANNNCIWLCPYCAKELTLIKSQLNPRCLKTNIIKFDTLSRINYTLNKYN